MFDVDLDHLAETVFVKFLHFRDAFPALTLSTLYSLVGSHYAQSTLKEWEFMFPNLRVKHLHNLSEILLHGRFVSVTTF